MSESAGLESEFMDEIGAAVDAGDVRIVTQNDEWAGELVRKFPFSKLGRLAWWEMPDGAWILEKPGPSEMSQIRSFLLASIAQARLNRKSNVVLIGDAMSSIVVCSTLNGILKWLHVLLAYPQHSYLGPVDFGWCFSCSFEGHLHFGFADGHDPSCCGCVS